MVENGHDVAVIEYHSGDEYQNSYGTARISYYNVTGYPTVKLDGILSQSGASGDMYPTYLAMYNQRKNIMSDFTIDVTGERAGYDYDIVINVEKVGSAGIDNPRLHVAVTETDIPENWGGLSEVNWVERLMVPNQNGTTLDFSGSSTEEVSLSFSVDQTWVHEKLAIVVFLQNHTTKEILQGAEYIISDFLTTNTTDAALISSYVPSTACLGMFNPTVEIANFGLNNLTSLDINYQVDNGTPMVYNWTGDLVIFETTLVELPEISFDIQASNTFTIACENPNGEDDQHPTNDSQSNTILSALQAEHEFMLKLKPDNNPEEISWEIIDSQNNILFSGGNYTNSNPVFVNIELSYSDCYSFIIYDEGGDGLTGSGEYGLFYGEYPNYIYFIEGSTFGHMEESQFSIDVTGVNETKHTTEITVSPNPIMNNANISFVLDYPEVVSMKVYNSLGRVVYQTESKEFTAGNHNMTFRRNNLDAGIYFINIQKGDALITEKVILK